MYTLLQDMLSNGQNYARIHLQKMNMPKMDDFIHKQNRESIECQINIHKATNLRQDGRKGTEHE